MHRYASHMPIHVHKCIHKCAETHYENKTLKIIFPAIPHLLQLFTISR